jgi:hypothetical protein
VPCPHRLTRAGARSRARFPAVRSVLCGQSVLFVATVGAATNACTILVPTDDLTGPSAPDSHAAADSGAPISSTAGGKPGGDASGLASVQVDAAAADLDAPEEPEVRPPSDASVAPSDASVAADVAAFVDAGRDTGVTASGVDAAKGPCAGDLSNIGTGDFQVSFELRTTASGRVALVNQRTACSSGMFWDLRLSGGEIEIQTDDGSHSTDLTGTGPEMDDGAPHSVRVSRVAGTLTISVDGATSGTGASAASFGALPPLVTGSDGCDGQDGTVPFSGTISNLCVGSP